MAILKCHTHYTWVLVCYTKRHTITGSQNPCECESATRTRDHLVKKRVCTREYIPEVFRKGVAQLYSTCHRSTPNFPTYVISRAFSAFCPLCTTAEITWRTTHIYWSLLTLSCIFTHPSEDTKKLAKGVRSIGRWLPPGCRQVRYEDGFIVRVISVHIS